MAYILVNRFLDVVILYHMHTLGRNLIKVWGLEDETMHYLDWWDVLKNVDTVSLIILKFTDLVFAD